MALNDRQKRFVAAYLSEPVGARAYRTAGYASTVPAIQARLLMCKPAVRAAVEEGQRVIMRDAELVLERIVAARARIAFATIDDILHVGADGGVLVDLTSAEALSAKFDVTIDDKPRFRRGWKRVRRVRITLASKLKALDALAQQLGMAAKARSRS